MHPATQKPEISPKLLLPELWSIYLLKRQRVTTHELDPRATTIPRSRAQEYIFIIRN